MLLGQEAEGGDGWQVRWLAFSLDQTKVAGGETDVWDDPDMAGNRLAVEVGIAVRDGWPSAFPAVHRDLFAARHDKGLDIRDHDVLAEVLTSDGLDADAVFNAVLGGGPRETFRAEHTAAVRDHKVFGVPTIIAGDRASFLRILSRPGEDATTARRTVQRAFHLLDWADLNEFKHTSIPR